jgi:hypothetical protein
LATHKPRFFKHVRDRVGQNVVIVVEKARDLVREPFLDHRHIDLLHVHFAIELGRKLGLLQLLSVDIGDES